MNNAKKFERAHQLVESGMSRPEACAKYDLKKHVYQYYLGKLTGAPKKERKASKQALIIHNVPTQPVLNSAFLIVGRPEELAEFARNFQR
jgi:hypothetical protein